MGYIRGFVHGAMAGTVLGLCIAPQTGERTRAQLGTVTRAARGGYGAARRTARQVAPAVSGAVGVVGHRVGAMRHKEEATSQGDGLD